MESDGDVTQSAGSAIIESPPALRFLLFGHARVFANGEPFRLATPRKTLPVLAYLLLNRDAAVSRSFLSFLLWPDETEDGARTKLRSTLYDLVRVLPPAPDGHWIVVEGTNVRWNPEAHVTLDVDAFKASLTDPERLGQAIELYTGDLLTALYDEWIIAPRERYQSSYLSALGQLISQSRRRLDYPKAITYAKRLLETDPLREDVARRLIALRYEAGDRSGALEEYERFERHVREELDIDPMPETAALREAIIRNDAAFSEETASEDRATAQASKSTLPFVGRRVEMEQLLDAWSRAARGRGNVVFVGGDPGIGKSRLVAEFAREVDERGGRVVIGATGSPETMPYQAFIEALRAALPLLASLKLEGIWFAVLATLVPELTARVTEMAALPNIDPENERARLIGALARAFVALAHPRPLLLVLEDLHWAEEATIAALAFLARRVALSPILVVATYRDNETIGRHPLRRARIDTTVEGVARSIVLHPLSLEEVGRLAEHFAPPLHGPALALHRASDGNPLLIGQLLEDAADVRSDRPRRVAEVIEARVERLSPEARRVAEIAALVGQRFSREVVREVGGWDGPTFVDALDELLDRRIVREATGRGVLDYAFAHQTVCDVVARGAMLQRSPDRHRRIARTLEGLYPERASEFAAELGRHYEIAGEHDAAAAHFLTAARRALSLAALDEATTFLRRGLALGAAPDVRKALLVEFAHLSKRTGDLSALDTAAAELFALAEATNDEESRRIAALLAVQIAAATDDEAARRAALGRLASLTADAGAKWRVVSFLEEARAAYGRADLNGVQAVATLALAAARECGDDLSAAHALTLLADVEINRANLIGAQALLEQVQAEAVRARDGAVEINSLRASFMLAYNMADAERCLAIGERLLERGIALGDRHAEADGRVKTATALISARRGIARARADLLLAQSIFEELRSQRGLAGVLINRGILENVVGDFATAVTHTEQALEIFVALDDARGRGTALANLAALHAFAGDASRGRRAALESIEIARAANLRIVEACALENLAIATASLGETTEAIRIGEDALALHRELDFSKWSGMVLSDLAMWHAELGELGPARARVEQMLEQGDLVWAEWPQRFHWAAAQVLHECGEHDRARLELARAHENIADITAELAGADLNRYVSVPWNRAIEAAHDHDEWAVFPPTPPP